MQVRAAVGRSSPKSLPAGQYWGNAGPPEKAMSEISRAEKTFVFVIFFLGGSLFFWFPFFSVDFSADFQPAGRRGIGSPIVGLYVPL